MTAALIVALIVCSLLMRRMAVLKQRMNALKDERDAYRRSTYDLAAELKQIKTRNVVLQRDLNDARWLIDDDLNQMVKAER